MRLFRNNPGSRYACVRHCIRSAADVSDWEEEEERVGGKRCRGAKKGGRVGATCPVRERQRGGEEEKEGKRERGRESEDESVDDTGRDDQTETR